MKFHTNSHHRNVCCAVALAAILGAAASDVCRAAGDGDLAAIWNDPSFQKAFIGGYGINSEIEPRITPEELKVLEKIRPMMENDLPGAEAALSKLIKPDSSAILIFTLGAIQFQQNKPDDALASYQKAVESFPRFRRAWRNLGLLYAQTSKHDEAIGAFTKMFTLGGGDALSYGLIGFAYAAKQDFQAAEVAFRNAMLLEPENLQWRLNLTRCVFKQEKFEDAASLLNVLIEKFPDKVEFWLLQSSTYIGMKQPLKAAMNLEMVDRLGKATADSLFTLGDIYVTENLMDLAAGAYQRAVSADPAQPLARSMRSAEVLAARGATDQARLVATHIKKTREKQLDQADQRRLLKLEARLSMAKGAGDDETARILQEVVKLDQLDGEAHMMLGQHFASRGEPDKAILSYESASRIEAFEVTAKVRHAQILVGMHRYADAIPLLRRAQELKPREDVARYLEQVERFSKGGK